MKKLLLLLPLIAQAQAASPVQVCEQMSRVNASNANICAQIISRNQIDDGLADVALRALSASSSAALDVLRAGANRFIDRDAATACVAVAAVNSANAASCINAVADKRIDSELANVAIKLTQRSSSEAVAALNAGANAQFFAPLIGICRDMVAINSSNSVACIRLVANKISYNGTESICRSNLSQSSSAALECLRGIVVPVSGPITDPVGPVDPSDREVRVRLSEIRDVKRELTKARAMLDRGLVEAARQDLDQAIRKVDRLAH